jgi:cyclohexadieny/prephenate dehydrogenase
MVESRHSLNVRGQHSFGSAITTPPRLYRLPPQPLGVTARFVAGPKASSANGRCRIVTTAFGKVAIVGLGLIGSSIARGIRETMPGARISAYDSDADVRERARGLALADVIADEPEAAVGEADLVILCVPVGAMAQAAGSIAPHLRPDVLVSDVGSSKAAVSEMLREHLPGVSIIPAHPVAGTENSGPEAGFAALFRGRWCILTPDGDARAEDVERLSAFWRSLGAKVELMEARHHDLVLAVTSHLPHLIAFTIVGTAADLERVTRSEVIKYSAGGFRDFTRIAASNPTMWRDIFLTNTDAVLDMIQRFNQDLAFLEQAIRGGDGDTLLQFFTRAREIRRSVVEQGQDVAKPDFGRLSEQAGGDQP